MASFELPPSLEGLRVHLVGAKGTGMAALAEILAAKGATLTGSDVADVFYTDAILKEIGLVPAVGFAPEHLGPEVALVIHSAAFARDKNPELLAAAARGLPILNYPEALGSLSKGFDSSGIAGVHGKTTTTAMAGSVIAAMGLSATVLAGSAVANFGGRSTIIKGDRFFVAETCEYRRHFMAFHPRRIVLTSVESDHQDFFPTYESIRQAFVDYGLSLPPGGTLIYCADDPGAASVAQELQERRADLKLVPYGRKASGPFRLVSYEAAEGEARFRLQGFDLGFALRVPGEHLVLDAIAALALALQLAAEVASPGEAPAGQVEKARDALADFRGSKRRSELLGEAGGIVFMDDYGHHPTAIKETIAGIRAFWPKRRLVVDFMSHTASRTRALFPEFAACLDEADLVVLHKVYPSAREAPDPEMTGRLLWEAVDKSRRAARPGARTLYFEEVLEARGALGEELHEGDLFLTMGAGDNWVLGQALLNDFAQRATVAKDAP